MVDRRALDFPLPNTPTPAGGIPILPTDAVVLLDSPSSNTFRYPTFNFFTQSFSRLPLSAADVTAQDVFPVVRLFGSTGLVEVIPLSLLAKGMPLATTTVPGNLSAADKAKLDQLNPTLQVKTGGTAGQVYTKLSTQPNDAAWATPTGGGGGGGGTLNTVVNVGAGAPLVKDVSGGIASIRSLVSLVPAMTLAVSVDGNTVTISVANANGTNAGYMSPADFSKLAGIQPGAQANPPVFTGGAAGLVPAANVPSSPSRFLNEQGIFAVPPTGGGGGGGGVPEAPNDVPDAVYVRSGEGQIWLQGVTISHTHAIANLDGIDLTGILPGGILRYNGVDFVASAEVIPNLSQLGDVQFSALSNNDVVTYNSTTQKWNNKPVGGTASTTSIPLGSPALAGPVTHALAAGDMGKVTRCDLSAGEVLITVDNLISTPVGELLVAQFLTEKGNGTNKLRFANLNTAVSPSILGSAIAQSRTTGVNSTPLAADAQDTRIDSVPPGVDRAVIYILGSLRAVDANPNVLNLNVGPTGSMTSRTFDFTQPAVSAGPDTYLYVHPMGTDAVNPTNVQSQVVLTGLNAVNYVLVRIFVEHMDQTLRLEGANGTTADNPTSTAFNQQVSTSGAVRRAFYFAMQTGNITGNPVPSYGTTATQLVAGIAGNTFNNASGPYIAGHEDAPAAGLYTATTTFPNNNDRGGISFALIPATAATMEIRTEANGPSETTASNKLVTALYSANQALLNLVM